MIKKEKNHIPTDQFKSEYYFGYDGINVGLKNSLKVSKLSNVVEIKINLILSNETGQNPAFHKNV